jgi:hypothetical protein
LCRDVGDRRALREQFRCEGVAEMVEPGAGKFRLLENQVPSLCDVREVGVTSVMVYQRAAYIRALVDRPS